MDVHTLEALLLEGSSNYDPRGDRVCLFICILQCILQHLLCVYNFISKQDNQEISQRLFIEKIITKYQFISHPTTE